MSEIHQESRYSKHEIEREIDKLYTKMRTLNWSREDCSLIAPLTLEINDLKKNKNAVILAHSYQMPQIIFGVADFVGDSYSLSQEAMEVEADIIVFCGVEFMAETAKLLNPEKTVFIPSREAGCSLAEGITPEDVKQLRSEYPNTPVVCYINTTADVKAECDICVTSGNVVKIIDGLDSDNVIFVPDRHMADNLVFFSEKNIIGWNAECIVHDEFTPAHVKSLREQFKGIRILAHTECDPSVAALADLVGGTGDMIRYIKNSKAKDFALITECGLSERLRVEFPEKNFLGSCILCPYMKKINLENIRQVLIKPTKAQTIELPKDIRTLAKKSLERMFELTNG
jgi:quinolinate synthase